MRIPLPVLALVIGAAPFVLHAVVALRGFYWQDDFLITYRAARGHPGDLAFLFQEYGGHLSPGMFVLAWAATAISPLNYAALTWPLLIMQAAALVLFWRLLVDIFGNRAALLVPFAVYAFSPLILFSSLWWAYGVQLIPLLLAMFGALWAHLRYLRTGSARYVLYAILWILFGMAFYEKAALIGGLLFGVTVLLDPARGLGTAVRRHWRVWVAHLVLLASYAATYIALTGGGTERSSAADEQIPELIRRMVLDTLLIPTAGVPTGTGQGGSTGIPPQPPGIQLLCTLAIVAVVFAGVVYGGRRAVYAWLLLAGYLAVDVGLVVVARLPLLGAIVGTESRFVADAVPVAVLCATFAFLPVRGEAEPRVARLPTRAVAAAMTVLMMIGTTVSFVRLTPAFPFTDARAYVATARVELAKRPDISIYDGPVPEQVMLSWFGGDARASRVLGQLPTLPRFDQPGETVYALDATGTPRAIERMANIVDAPPGPSGDCGYAVTEQAVIVPLRAGVFGRRVLRLAYFTGDTGDGWVSVPGSSIKVTFEQGLHNLYVPIQGLYGSVAVRRDSPGAPVCVASLQVGEPIV